MHSSKSQKIQQFLKEVQAISPNTVKADIQTLGLYATDASLYQVFPLAVAIPRDENELIDIIRLANQYEVPVLPRGSATSLAGQTVNKSLVIDFTRYFSKILEINVEERYAIVQPGVVRDWLNDALKPHRLHFAPDPATTSRATFGGMIANNSSGTRSIKYGKTIDHLLELKVLLMDGTILRMGALTPDAYDEKCRQKDREGAIYRKFRSIIHDNKGAIKEAYPTVLRRVQGYPLDEFIGTDQWNFAKILSGSEGSLGIILEAKVHLEPLPNFRAAYNVHYNDRMKAIREVQKIVDFHPVAVEMLDYNVFRQSIRNNVTKELHKMLIEGKPEATLFVEFYADTQQKLDEQITTFGNWLKENSSGYAFPLYREEKTINAAIELRKKGLGLIMGDPTGRKPIPFIEDQAIPLEHLADYIQAVLYICDKYDVKTVLYAHASVGVLHVRPELDMTKQEDIEIMKNISSEVFKLVKQYKGSWSGEHGDGRNRGPKLREYFGEEVYQCLREVKEAFDPKYLLNPGIIIDVPPMDEHLRYGTEYKEKKYDFVYQYRKDLSFENIVHNCSGLGVCRNHYGGGMCPSFRATLDEKSSTRGRANALRLGISGQFGFSSLTDPKVLDTLDLCLSCKACKSECPSNVDMAKLKSEVLQLKHDESKISLKEKAIRENASMSAKIAGWKAPIFNFFLKNSLFKRMSEKWMGIDRRRQLPLYATTSLEKWYHKHYKPKGYDRKVVLFADTYINYHEIEVGKAAIRLLNECGYEVLLAAVGCCQRPRISNGFLKEAKAAGTAVVEQLIPYMEQGLKIVVCEPSCTSAFLDDIPDLLENEAWADQLQNHVQAIDVFLSEALESGALKGKFVATSDHILLHGHCHQKSLFGTAGMHHIYDSIEGLQYYEPDSGCCGMAGSFGYEKEHYDVSKKVADLVLIPEINKTADQTLIVTSGFSCRHQINDFTDRTPVHWVESIRFVQDTAK